MNLPEVILITIPGCQPIIGKVLREEEDILEVEYPVILYKEDPYIYTMPYIPYAKAGVVSFNKSSIISVALVDLDIKDYYAKIVTDLKEQPIKIKISTEEAPSEVKKIPQIKIKTLH